MKYLAAPPILVALVAVWLLYVFAGGMVSFTEVMRSPSPDARLDAIVIESDGGATTDYGYFVPVDIGPDTRPLP